MSERAAFYDVLRPRAPRGVLLQNQVEGIEAILDVWDELLADDTWLEPDARWLAYPLATAAWETGWAMRPVRETGRGQGKPYGVPDPETGQTYYGRGFVQITWRGNYQRQQNKLRLPLVRQPDLALEPRVAALILLRGMSDGDFTGRSLRHYFRADGTSDPVRAREIVNGMDRAEQVAGLYDAFLPACEALLPQAAA